MLRDQIERYNQRLRDFEEKQRAYRQHQERPTDPDLEVRSRRCLLSILGHRSDRARGWSAIGRPETELRNLRR